MFKKSSILLLLFVLLLMGMTLFIVIAESETILEMITVNAGTTASNNGNITITNDFYIAKYPVTQAQFSEVMGFNPSYFINGNLTGDSDNRPVEQVTWYDAVMFCNKLSEREEVSKYYNISNIKYNGKNIISAKVTENKDSRGYRLPTQDEREYAARGGVNDNATIYAGSNNLDDVGWYEDNSQVANSQRSDKRGTIPVGVKQANELGLYDMSGNVWEWTNTVSGSYRIVSGGSWYYSARLCAVGYRGTSPSSGIGNSIGFRPARSF